MICKINYIQPAFDHRGEFLARRKNQKASIRGIVIPSKWDEKGTVIEVTIQAFDEKVYVVEHTGVGDQLLGFIRRQVEVSGKFKPRLDGKTLVQVQSFSSLNGKRENSAKA